MNADELTQAQCRVLKNKLEPMTLYLHKLRVWMQKRGLPPDDPMMQLDLKSGEAVHELYNEVFCRSTDGKGFKPEHRD